MSERREQKNLTAELKTEIANWQTKVDEVRLQMHLGAKEARDKIEPHVETLEHELNQAKQKLEQLNQGAESAWDEIKRGINISFKAMQQAIEKAEKHIPGKEKK